MKKAAKSGQDSRVNARYPVWREYIIILIVMLCLTGGQALIFYSSADISSVAVPPLFIVENTGYWALMTIPVTWVMLSRRRLTHDRPMRMLSDAARQVAGGDFSVYLPPIRTDGKKDYVEVMFDDFNTMTDELGSIEMLTNDFISNVSHEIKTPLSVIQSYAEALRKTDITLEQRAEYTDTIISASQKLNTLVANILKLSKLENQKVPFAAEEFDLCRQLCDCALSTERLWEEKNITFNAEMDDRAFVCADKSILEIVWNNLLSNALKFTDPGGTVTLKQSSDGDTVTVAVSDTGCGMTKETMGRIFDKFYQGDTSHSKEGNGLGLALSLRAAQLAGGAISVESEPGKGSVFTVKLNSAR